VRTSRRALFALAAAAVAVPFLAVDFPPITDLPQHLAQVRLLGEALGEADSPYRVQWLTPYGLVYLVFAAAWAVAEPVAAGRLAMAVLAIGWVGAVHLLAARRGRPATAALAASVLVFHQALYWGFASFLLGWPLFAGWFLLVARKPAPPGRRWREATTFLAAAAVLYLAHALWFAAAVAWLLADAAVARRRPGELAARLAGVAPVGALAAWWFAGIGGTSFATPPLWVAPLRRLDPRWWVEAAFGGLTSGVETAAFVALLAWLALAVVAGRRRAGGAPGGEGAGGEPRDGGKAGDGGGEAWDGRLALLAAGMLLAVLLAPDKYTNTIELNTRWAAPGLAALLLAAPAPRLPRRAAAAVAALLLVGFATWTAATWRLFERVELAGLPAALAALPPEPRVLGLDYRRRSALLDNPPYLQVFAWAQVLRGGVVNFSFAQFPPSLVVYRQPQQPWSSGLEWFPERLRSDDLAWFDHALVDAPPALHDRIALHPAMEPVTTDGFWRLYRLAPTSQSAPHP
jgi:hypothetical protein